MQQRRIAEGFGHLQATIICGAGVHGNGYGGTRHPDFFWADTSAADLTRKCNESDLKERKVSYV
jgi:hypothetical protein